MSIENVTLSDSIKSLERSDEQGKCAGTIHIASDVTEQREKWNQAIQRVIIIVLDGVGVGAMPDAHLYGDEGSNTLGNIADVLGELQLPNFGKPGAWKNYTYQGHLSFNCTFRFFMARCQKSRQERIPLQVTGK